MPPRKPTSLDTQFCIIFGLLVLLGSPGQLYFGPFPLRDHLGVAWSAALERAIVKHPATVVTLRDGEGK